MEENEYRKINNDDKKEFLLNKEEEKNETPDDFKKIQVKKKMKWMIQNLVLNMMHIKNQI